MGLQACASCASPRLRPASHADGAYAGGGELLFWVCESCGQRGQPLVFEDKAAYRAFSAGVAQRREPKRAAPADLTRGDLLDRLTAKDTLVTLAGAAFALAAVASFAGLALLWVAGEGRWLSAMGGGDPASGGATAKTIFGGIFFLVIAYLFLRPGGPRLSPGSPGVRARVRRPAWLAPLLMLVGGHVAWVALSSQPGKVWMAADLVGAGPPMLGLVSALLLASAILLWGVGVWRDRQALRSAPANRRARKA